MADGLSTGAKIALGASTAVSAAGTIASGRAAAAQAAHQAAIAAQQAEYERQLFASQERKNRRDNNALLARQRARLAASGVDLSSGSALLAQMDAGGQAELEARMIRTSGEAKASNLLASAQLARMRGAAEKQRAIFGAGTKLLDGAAMLSKK